MFGAHLRPHRLDGHALLGRPRERNHLRRAHVAAEPGGETPPARPGGGACRGGSPALTAGGSQALRLSAATAEKDVSLTFSKPATVVRAIARAWWRRDSAPRSHAPTSRTPWCCTSPRRPA